MGDIVDGALVSLMKDALRAWYDVRVTPADEAHLANALGALRHRKFKREYMQAG